MKKLENFHSSFLKDSLNPLSDGLQIKAVLMGDLENEATESCEGSK